MPCHAMPCHAMPCHAMPCHLLAYIAFSTSNTMSIVCHQQMIEPTRPPRGATARGRWPSGLERRPATGRSMVRAPLRETFRFRTLAIPFTPFIFLPVSFGGDNNSRRSLLSGVYARGSKIPHQSALECVTVVDSTAHSKSPRSAYMRLKTLPCTEKEELRRCLH